MTASLVVIRRFVIGLTAVIGLAGLYVGQNTQALGLGGIVPAVDAATTTGLVASPNPAFAGQAVTFTAIVTSTFEITPTGVVTFTDGAATLGLGTLSNGQISINTSALSSGPHVITATYGGDDNHAGSISPILITVVNHRPFVDAGRNHACAIKANSILVCWGDDGYGGSYPPPTTFDNPFVQVSAGGGHTCAVKADGALACWGRNSFGETNVPPDTTHAVQVSAGWGHTCAIQADGTLACWVNNQYGQTTVPTTTVPFMQVSAGEKHTCGLKMDGTLTCWGDNESGQTTVPPTASPFIQVSAGGEHTCGAKLDGTLACWGNDDYGQARMAYLFWMWGPPPDAVVGVPYSRTLGAFGGSGGTFSFSVISGTLPTGLTLSTTGVLSGTPTALGTFSFGVQVHDANNLATALASTITVNPANYTPLTAR